MGACKRRWTDDETGKLKEEGGKTHEYRGEGELLEEEEDEEKWGKKWHETKGNGGTRGKTCPPAQWKMQPDTFLTSKKPQGLAKVLWQSTSFTHTFTHTHAKPSEPWSAYFGGCWIDIERDFTNWQLMSIKMHSSDSENPWMHFYSVCVGKGHIFLLAFGLWLGRL